MKLCFHLFPYLLLVSFSAGPMNSFGPAKMEALDRTRYDGAAVQLYGPYYTGHCGINGIEEAAIFFLREKPGKQIWPWIFFNRFLGSQARGQTHSPLSGAPAFRRIKGMDLYNEEGALGDFFTELGTALLAAHRLGSPGIVIDPEFYNDYSVSGVPALARRMGKPEGEVKKRLEAVGQRMCDVADRQYPGAVMWFLDTGLANAVDGTAGPGFTGRSRRYRAFTYIVRGLLEQAKKTHSRITVVSGGEISLGYCQKSLEGLKQGIKRRGMEYAELLREYPNLALGGTIAPWVSSGTKKGWMEKGHCASSGIRDLEGFRPLVKELLASYNYVWIYGAWAGGYDPFHKGHSVVPFRRGTGPFRQ